MIKKILKNINISNEEKDDNFSHSQNIINLIEEIIKNENDYWKYVNILDELATLCYEDPIDFRKSFFSKNEQKDEQKNEKKNEKKKENKAKENKLTIDKIIDRILIVLEKYEDSRNTFIYAISKLIFINDYNFNIKILTILCNLAINDEYKIAICSALEEIVTSVILNSSEKQTIDNIFVGLNSLPQDKIIANSFKKCIYKIIRILKSSFNEHILKLLSICTLDKEICLISYDEGLLKILIKEMKKYSDDDFDDVPNYLKDVYLTVCNLCGNYFKHCEMIINEKLHITLYFKKIKEIINIGEANISQNKSIYSNLIILTLNNISNFSKDTLVELCNTMHIIDLFLIAIKMDINNPYYLSGSLGGLLLILKNKETYNNNIEYILQNTNNLKILMPLLFGNKYNNIFNYFKDSDDNVENYLFEIVKSILDIISFFFQKELDKYSIKVKKELRNSNINQYLFACLEKKNENIIIRMLKFIYQLSFEDYKFVEIYKIFYILNEKNITINNKWREIYYYCIKIYIKIIINEKIKTILDDYNFKEIIINIFRIVNEFLLHDLILQRKANFSLLKNNDNSDMEMFIGVSKCILNQNENFDNIYEIDIIDLNKATVELLCICSKIIELRNFIRNPSISYYFNNIVINEDSLYSEENINYDILIERTWACNIENIFKILMKNNVSKNKKIYFRLLINMGDIFSGYFYQFKTYNNMNIFDLCNLEDKHWNKKNILKYFLLMSDIDRKDCKEQLSIFLNQYIGNLFSLLTMFIEDDIFLDLKKEQKEQYFPGVLKYYKLEYEKKIYHLKLKEKKIKNIITNFKHEEKDNNPHYTHLVLQLQNIHKKKKKLFLQLSKNNFTKTFDISLVDNEIESNLDNMFEISKPKKKKIKSPKKEQYMNFANEIKEENSNDNNLGKDDKNEVIDDDKSKMIENNVSKKMSSNVKNDVSHNMDSKYINGENSFIINGENSFIINGENSFISNGENSFIIDEENIDTDCKSSSESSISSDPNVTVLDKISSELLNFNKEVIYKPKIKTFNILLFNKRGLFVNSSKGEINESYILDCSFRIFYSIIINNIDTEFYTKLEEFLLKNNVLKAFINLLNKCSFYDCNVYAHFFRLYNEILKKNVRAIESMDMLIFYNIFCYYLKLISKEFIKKLRNNEYNISDQYQYFFSELCQLFYYFTQKIIYIQFSQYNEIQKWCVDCSLYNFFYKNNILLLLYLFIYINNIHHGSEYKSYIYHKKNFNYIHTIFFYTLHTISYLMCFSPNLKYFILYFINYKKFIHKILFRKSLIHSIFFYHKLIYLRVLLQNYLSQKNKRPTQIYHISPVIYIRNNAIEWYFLAIGFDKYYLVFIPDNFESNITDFKVTKLVIYSEKKYKDITRICISKINDNFFVLGNICFDKNIPYESYDIFISINKYYRDEIILYSQFLSGSNYETRVDIIQDTIIINNLKNYMNVHNIIITSFAYKEIKEDEIYEQNKKNKIKKRQDNLNNSTNIYEYETSEEYDTNYDNTNDSNYSQVTNFSNKLKESDNSDTQSNNEEECNIFRTNISINKKKKKILLFFVLTKNHLYVFKLNFKNWIFLSPFIDEEKNDIKLYVESIKDSDEEQQKNNIFINEKIFLNNFIGMTANIINDENTIFARKYAITNTAKNIYSHSNSDYTNDQILSTNVTTSITTTDNKSVSLDQTNNSDTYNNKRYMFANQFFLNIKHKYNNEYLSMIKFINKCESIISLIYKIEHKKSTEKKIKIIMFDDYTRELWKRSLAYSLNIQMASSEWRRTWK
ncbi:conserved Plasmodium protein, unknown function [Plasmodium yoelii]|uniref:Uncharacterized protein n=1 Tax=Plasmodium yoelii TaxID=5861 RepID=A0A077Y897_PLAYE|nr:conserved Plasmodium protein, unknown function [Plasmodium yoelii]CDU17870.1 conserved Plasmodium protein, unknown function [Plasmodium yoelii]VTZ78287.1 conserved Plasmodium protein, unknown function [Plasmodium yoelii]|eukprot:XP_022812142.1 conserved Plasmodium protein, unknown function [Plasmodium yoelii]